MMLVQKVEFSDRKSSIRIWVFVSNTKRTIVYFQRVTAHICGGNLYEPFQKTYIYEGCKAVVESYIHRQYAEYFQ